MAIKKIFIKGMHCASCEILLEQEFSKLAGVKDVKINRKENSGQLEYNQAEFDFSQVKRAAEKLGYQISENNENEEKPKNKWLDWTKAIAIVIIFLILYKLFQSTGLTDKIDLRQAELSFGLSFLIGLVASISSCLAVVGSVVLAFAEKYKIENGNSYKRIIKPNLLFQIGRLSTFFILGGALGLIGSQLKISGNFISVFTLIVAAVMAWLGLNILGLVPSITNFLPRSSRLNRGWQKLQKSEHNLAPLALGALTFFLPCGFTQSMQIFALASGSFLAGGLNLLFFALGTLPVLLILGITASWSKSKNIKFLQKVAGIIIIIFAIFTFNSGWALLGSKINVFDNNNTDGGNNQTTGGQVANEQTVVMNLTASGFMPSTIPIKKGQPVKWVIKGDYVTGCTSRIIIPSLNIAQNISYGENIIRFTPPAGVSQIPFSCWMGMVRGKFIVEL